MSRTVRRGLDLLLSSRALLIGVLLAGGVAGTAFLFGGSSHTVVAEFADANGLVAGNEIRVAGIEAGKVDSVNIVVDGAGGKQYAQAVLDVNGDHWPLHQGTTLAVRPKGVLSNVFVSLQPGSAAAPVIDASHVFGLGETSSPVNLDEFNNLFDPDVRTAIRTQIQEGVIAFGGSGAGNLNATIHNLNPLTSDLAPLTAVLAQRSPELDRLNTEFDTITSQLASQDQNLRGLIQNGDVFLGALAARQHEIQGTLDHAAGTLTSIDNGLKGEESNLAALFQKGPAALDKTKRASDLLNPLISYVNPYIPHLDNLLYEFVSATGFQATCNAPAHGQGCQDYAKDGGMMFTFRTDVTIPPSNRSAIDCGGEPVEQRPQTKYDSNCSQTPNVGTSGGSTSGGSPSGGASPQGAPPPQGSSPSQGGPSLFGALFGGLFG